MDWDSGLLRIWNLRESRSWKYPGKPRSWDSGELRGQEIGFGTSHRILRLVFG